MTTPFVEERFNTWIRYGVSGGPTFNTNVVVVDSGNEVRNINWDAPLGMWDLGGDNYDRAEVEYLIAFFRARKGKGIGFRFKDWSDYLVDSVQGIVGTGIGIGTSNTYQLNKRYTTPDGDTSNRIIKKPVNNSTIKLYVNSVLQVAGYTVSYSTGVITVNSVVDKVITGATQASPGVLTITAHGFTSGQIVWLSGIVGMTALNAQKVTVTVISPNSFSIGVNTSAYGAYVSGGQASLYYQATDVLRWSGEFDTPARFDTDKFNSEFLAFRDIDKEAIFLVSGLPIIEVRNPS